MPLDIERAVTRVDDVHTAPRRIQLVPYVDLVASIVCVSMAVLVGVLTPAVLINSSPEERADSWYIFPIIFVIFVFASWLTLSSTRERWGTLSIGEHIEYRQRWGNVRLKLPRHAAHDVRIQPGFTSKRPTDYQLRVKISGKLYALLFAEHWMFGGRKLILARRVAEELGIPMSDARVEQKREGRLLRARWMGWMGRGSASVQIMRLLVGLAHVLLPLYFAFEIVHSPERFGELTAAASFLLNRGVPLLCVGILTWQALCWRQYPDEPGAMAAVLLTPPLFIGLRALLYGIPVQHLVFDTASFYLGLFVLTSGALAFWRFAVQRTIGGWEWAPVTIALALLFVPGVTAFYTFVRVLVELGVLTDTVHLSLFMVSLVVAAISEVRIVLKHNPPPPAKRVV